MKRPVKKADEYDLISRTYRRFQMRTAGLTNSIKRRLRRRYRHEAKNELRQESE